LSLKLAFVIFDITIRFDLKLDICYCKWTHLEECYHMTWYENNLAAQLQYRDPYLPCGVRKHFQLKVTPYLILSNMLFIKCELDLIVKLAFVIYYMPMRFEREVGVLSIVISRCRMISTKNIKYKTSNCHKSVQRHMDPTATDEEKGDKWKAMLWNVCSHFDIVLLRKRIHIWSLSAAPFLLYRALKKLIVQMFVPTLTLFYRWKESKFNRSVLRLFFCMAHWIRLSLREWCLPKCEYHMWTFVHDAIF